MGNRAKRAQLDRALRAQGLGRLYKGNKRKAFMVLNAYTMNEQLTKLSFKPGDIVNDCDAFNHRIKEWLPRQFSNVTLVEQFVDEQGQWSCGCGGSPDPAGTREEIEEYFNYTKEQVEAQGGWWTELAQARGEALRRGDHICDENGFVYNEFSRAY